MLLRVRWCVELPWLFPPPPIEDGWDLMGENVKKRHHLYRAMWEECEFRKKSIRLQRVWTLFSSDQTQTQLLGKWRIWGRLSEGNRIVNMRIRNYCLYQDPEMTIYQTQSVTFIKGLLALSLGSFVVVHTVAKSWYNLCSERSWPRHLCFSRSCVIEWLCWRIVLSHFIWVELIHMTLDFLTLNHLQGVFMFKYEIQWKMPFSHDFWVLYLASSIQYLLYPAITWFI